jgi:hypothetical protein
VAGEFVSPGKTALGIADDTGPIRAVVGVVAIRGVVGGGIDGDEPGRAGDGDSVRVTDGDSDGSDGNDGCDPTVLRVDVDVGCFFREARPKRPSKACRND